MRVLTSISNGAAKGSLYRKESSAKLAQYKVDLSSYSQDLVATIDKLILIINDGTMNKVAAACDLVASACLVNPFVPPLLDAD